MKKRYYLSMLGIYPLILAFNCVYFAMHKSLKILLMSAVIHFFIFALVNFPGAIIIYKPVDQLFTQQIVTDQAKKRILHLTQYSTGWIFLLGFLYVTMILLFILISPAAFEGFSLNEVPSIFYFTMIPSLLFVYAILPGFITYFLINDLSLDLKAKAFDLFQIIYPEGKKRVGKTLIFVFVIIGLIPIPLVIMDLVVFSSMDGKFAAFADLSPTEAILSDRFIVLIGFVIAIVLITRSFTKPIHALLEKIKKVREGNYAAAAVITEDEIGVLTKEFNDMVQQLEITHNQLEEHSRDLEIKVGERTRELKQKNSELQDTLDKLKQMQKQVIVQEKMASLGSLVAGIAHEINTPIGAVSSMYDTLSRTLVKMQSVIEKSYPEEFRKSAQLQSIFKGIEDANKVILSGTERVTTIVSRLRSFARLDEAELKTVDIHEGIEDTLVLIHHDIKHNIAIKKDFGDIPKISCYPGRLNQVFLNLLINSKQAITGNGTISITTRADDKKVYITFQDDGSGIAPENQKKIFDPGFTTRGRGVGTGLGLSICYQIIQEHRGEIKVESELEKGTTFEIILPLDLEHILDSEKKSG